MMALSRIVVGVEMPLSRPWDAANISAPSRIAVRQAFRLAESLNLPIRVVSVCDEHTAGFFSTEEQAKANSDAECAEAAAVLKDLVSQYSTRSGDETEVTCHVAVGRPWLEILKQAEADPKTLIVCGTRNRGVISQMIFGSTGQKLLRNSAGPVWLVKPRVDDDAVLDALVATDLSEIGVDLINAGVSIGQAISTRLSVVHVVGDCLDRHMARSGVSEEEIAEYQQKLRDDAEHALHDQLSMTDYRTLEHGVQVHVAEGQTEAAVLQAIEELDIDLLIMATAGRGGVPGMLFGNTAERLLLDVPCSVLVLKPDDFECPISL